MKILIDTIAWLVALAVIAAIPMRISYKMGCDTNPAPRAWVNPAAPVDLTGDTSIVVEYDNGEWAELRGPARYTVLEEWEAYGK